MQNAEERVADGATLLDHRNPSWYRDINLQTLRMEHCYNCVLGQVFGSFGNGLKELGVTLGAPLGFAISSVVKTGFESRKEYAALKAAWIEQIEGRLLLDSLDFEESRVEVLA